MCMASGDTDQLGHVARLFNWVIAPTASPQRTVSMERNEGDVVLQEASVGAMLLLRSMGLNVEGRSSDGRGHC